MMSLHIPLLNNASVLSEAVSVLNGAHLGMNSAIGRLFKQQKLYEREKGGGTSHRASTTPLLKELNITTDVMSQLRGEWPIGSHDCRVTDIIHSSGLKKLRNPYLLFGSTTRRCYSTAAFTRNSRNKNYSGLLTTRWSSRRVSDFRIMQLETRANSETDNPTAQALYLAAVCETDPEYVIRRFESGRYAINEEVRSIYQKAINLTTSNSDNYYKNFDMKFPFGQQMLSDNASSGTGHKDSPLHVVVQSTKGGGIIREIWYFARFIILAFLITTFVSSALFTQMKGGTQQMTKDFRPDMTDREYKFDDVQGIDEAKAEVQEMVEFLRNPSRFKKLGAKLPTGMLLIGPPGTGKTLLAKAIAGEADVPFFFASGSEFDEMFVGVGAARIRKLFEQARRSKPCVVFIDELDAVGGARITSAIHPYSRMTLNQLLVELDGYKELEGVVVIGATNFPESLDKALVRPGRFDIHIHIDMPDVKARHNILMVHSKKIKLGPDVSMEKLARGTIGFSGADLANLINQAALKASADGKTEVTEEDMEYAKDRILMGPEKKSAVIERENKEKTAYHEGGHAIVAMFTPGALPIHKATIVPRGPALGMVVMLPEKDQLSWTKKQLLASMDVAMGGRVAEEIMYGAENVTTGASSDFKKATDIATAMVTKYAMSDAVGPVFHQNKDKVSSTTQKIIEDEIKRLLKESHDRAYQLLKTHATEHKRLAEGLLKYETLDLEEIKQVISGKPLSRSV